MNKEQKFDLNNFFSKQISILRDINNKLKGELYEYYDVQLIKEDQNNKYEEKIKKQEKIKKKIENLEKIKIDLIKIYSKIISEY